MYAPNASFEDPLTHAQGYVAPPTNNFIFIDNESLFTLVYFLSLLKNNNFRVKQIKSAFYSLSKVYNKSHFDVYYYDDGSITIQRLNHTIILSLQVFGESKIVEYHIQESVIAPGKKEVRIPLF